MRILHRREAALLLSLCTALTSAISLSDFTPRNFNLPSICDAAYCVQIPNCQRSDFQPGIPCSADCIRGLMSVGARVSVDCKGAKVQDSSLVGQFLLGQGVEALCPNAKAPTIGSSFNPSATIGTSTGSPKTSQTAAATTTTKTTATGLLFDTSSSPLPPSTTAEAETTTTETESSHATLPAVVTTTAVTSANLATVGTAPAVVSTTLVSGVTTSRAPTQTQSSNQDRGSGGGSPFDVASAAAHGQVWSWGMVGAAAVAFAAYLV